VVEVVLRDTRARALEHALRQIDGCDRAPPRIQRQAHARSHADLEDVVVWLYPHTLDRRRATVMER
jgi:hypothetical protein